MGCVDKCMSCSKKLQGRCNDRLMMVTNLIASALIVVCIVLRFIYLIDKKTANVFFILLTIYLIIFLVIFVLAEVRNRRIRKYFNFLDSKIGRGCFLLFLGLLVFLRKRWVEIIIGIIIVVIAVANCIVGWG